MWKWKLKWRFESLIEELKDDKGIGVVEVILILVVLIGLVIIFKSQLTSLVQNIFEKIIAVKYDVPNDKLEMFDDYHKSIDEFYENVLRKNG